MWPLMLSLKNSMSLSGGSCTVRSMFYVPDFLAQRPTLSCRRTNAADYGVRMRRGNTQKTQADAVDTTYSTACTKVYQYLRRYNTEQCVNIMTKTLNNAV